MRGKNSRSESISYNWFTLYVRLHSFAHSLSPELHAMHVWIICTCSVRGSWHAGIKCLVNYLCLSSHFMIIQKTGWLAGKLKDGNTVLIGHTHTTQTHLASWGQRLHQKQEVEKKEEIEEEWESGWRRDNRGKREKEGYPQHSPLSLQLSPSSPLLPNPSLSSLPGLTPAGWSPVIRPNKAWQPGRADSRECFNKAIHQASLFTDHRQPD